MKAEVGKEMRLIDADRAAEIMDYLLDESMVNMSDPRAVRYNVRTILTELFYTPTVDAVEVVRCKDCNHWDPEWGDIIESRHGWCEILERDTGEEWYCADHS